MPLLQVEGFSKVFHVDHLHRDIQVFSEINFSIDLGQFLIVTGANGMGKSTLLRCLYRTYRVTYGHAWYESLHGTVNLATIADVDVALLRREEIGFVTQFLRPRPRVSAMELVAEPLLAAGASLAEAEPQAREMLATFGLKEELWTAYPTMFSGGEQQRVNLARALIVPRRLLLLDEPTASLDKSARGSLTDRLIQLKQQGVAMIGVFHFPDEVKHLIDGEVYLTNNSRSVTELETEHVAE